MSNQPTTSVLQSLEKGNLGGYPYTVNALFLGAAEGNKGPILGTFKEGRSSCMGLRIHQETLAFVAFGKHYKGPKCYQ